MAISYQLIYKQDLKINNILFYFFIKKIHRNGYQLLKSNKKRKKIGELISEVENAFLKSIDSIVDQVNEGKIIIFFKRCTIKLNMLIILSF